MKKQLFVITILALTSVASFAQGTIQFANNLGFAIGVDTDNDGIKNRNATAADGLSFSIYWGTNPGELTRIDTPATIGSTGGVLANAAAVFALPGSTEGATVSLQIRAQSADGQLFGQTKVAQVTLGPTSGPGTVIWQGASGTLASRFNPLVVSVVPEPSTIALGVLGLGSLLLFRRRK